MNETNKAIDFLNDCCESIANKGLYVKPKVNIVSDKSNLEILTIVASIITISFLSGFYLKEIILSSNSNTNSNVIKDTTNTNYKHNTSERK